MTNDHARCRREVIEDEMTQASRQHLEDCSQCARFAQRFNSTLRAAPSLAGPSMPPGLTARVLERVKQERLAGATSSLRPLPTTGWARLRFGQPFARRRRLILAAAMTALAAVVLAVTVVPILDRSSAQAALVEASRSTANRGTARVELQSRVEATLQSAGAPGAGRRRFTVVTSAKGGVEFDRRLHLQGSSLVEGVTGGIELEDEHFDLVATRGRIYERGPAGLRRRDEPPPIGLVLRRPDAVLDILSTGARAEVSDLGVTELDGERVRHYRFQLPSSVLSPPFGSSTASPWATDVWVAEVDKTLRRFSAVARGLASSASRVTWASSVGVRLSDFGEDVFPSPPRAGSLTAEGSPVLPLPPGATLSRYAGRQVEGRSVLVQSVAGDEAFWVGTSKRERVLVHLVTDGESPPRIKRGVRVSFTGIMRRNPEGRESFFGISPSEGLELLKRQGYHVEVRLKDLRRR